MLPMMELVAPAHGGSVRCEMSAMIGRDEVKRRLFWPKQLRADDGVEVEFSAAQAAGGVVSTLWGLSFSSSWCFILLLLLLLNS